MTQTIETLLADLCAKHDLTSISVEYRADVELDGYRWLSYAHWPAATTCASANGDSPEKAITGAIISAATKRAANTTVPSEITMEWAA